MVQWLRFHAPNTGALGSVLGQGTRSFMLQRKLKKKQTNKQLHATMKVKDPSVQLNLDAPKNIKNSNTHSPISSLSLLYSFSYFS